MGVGSTECTLHKRTHKRGVRDPNWNASFQNGELLSVHSKSERREPVREIFGHIYCKIGAVPLALQQAVKCFGVLKDQRCVATRMPDAVSRKKEPGSLLYSLNN